ncbi:hypothetical protein Q2T40_05640 [Winogradskyella maritima]|nr:hypothetical protein [Winogradskyella maritima]
MAHGCKQLLTGTDELPQSAIDDVKALTVGVDDKMERAKIVYKYMQDKKVYKCASWYWRLETYAG